MNITRRVSLGFISLVALAAGLASADELVLTDHHVMQGEVVSSTESSVTFSHMSGGQRVQTVIPADHIEPYSFYVVRNEAIGDDAAARMQLGQFCLDNGLYPRARRQFEQAAKLDPALKKAADAAVAKAREGSAAGLVAKANAEQSAGQANAAMSTLSEAVRYYGDTSAGDAARGQAGELHDQMIAQRAAARAAQENKEATQDVKKVQAALDRAAAYNKDGLQSKELSQSLQNYKKSLAEYQRALHELTELEKKFKDNATIVANLQGEATQAKSDMINVHMNMGAIYITRTSYQQALQEANQALVLDPKSSRATAFRQRVESCSSRGRTIL